MLYSILRNNMRSMVILPNATTTKCHTMFWIRSRHETVFALKLVQSEDCCQYDLYRSIRRNVSWNSSSSDGSSVKIYDSE
mmetsp:Transcript_21963/g.41622  ORF Transcript_21963/g.41622 Transcript_21963/m.41622 type:complete len:80 (+) Transcript_21963:183-422(+)